MLTQFCALEDHAILQSIQNTCYLSASLTVEAVRTTEQMQMYLLTNLLSIELFQCMLATNYCETNLNYP